LVVTGQVKGRRRLALALMALAAIALIVAACGGSGGTTTTGSTSESTETTESTPPAEETETTEAEPMEEGEEETGETAANWELPNGTLSGTRSVASEIEESNVEELGVAWTSPIIGHGTYGGWATTPVIVEGVMYGQDLESNVYAIDMETGKTKWMKKFNAPDEGPNGITVNDGMVLGATSESAFALNQETGEQMWTRHLTRNDQEGIDMAPGYNEGTVYVSTVPGNAGGFYEGNGKAILYAMDAKTGKVKWKWNQVQDLWGNPKVNSGGGQWQAPTFDSEGDVFVEVSNPAPWPGTKTEPWGESRPGPNLYTDSVVKLDKDTGKIDWYYQLTPHDIQDHDLNNQALLTEGAEGEDIVISGGKGGIAFAVDAENGKKLWETPIGKHNGHDKDNLYAMRHEYNKLPPLNKPYVVYPGALGGIETPYASDGKLTFMPVVNQAFNFTTIEPSGPESGEMVALDNATGEVKWDHKFKTGDYGAATVSNGLVWTTTFDGTLWALNAETGETVWSTKLPAGSNGSVAVDGDTVVTGAGFAQGAGQEPLIVAYKLGATGKLPTEEKGAGMSEESETKNPGADVSGNESASVAKGEEVFSSTCSSCHTLAAAGSNGTVGPNLDELKPEKLLVEKQVTNGGGGMPAFGSSLSKAEIESVAEFVSKVAGKPLSAEQKKKAAENGGGGGGA
jgi:outer membrane protein assembly factor BamB